MGFTRFATRFEKDPIFQELVDRIISNRVTKNVNMFSNMCICSALLEGQATSASRALPSLRSVQIFIVAFIAAETVLHNSDVTDTLN